MWNLIQEGACLIVECPSRWYIGRVAKRTHLTCILKDVVCGHDLGDMGMFANGKISTATELTPLPRQVEISFSAIETVHEYRDEYMKVISRRTHAPLEEKTNFPEIAA